MAMSEHALSDTDALGSRAYRLVDQSHQLQVLCYRITTLLVGSNQSTDDQSSEHRATDIRMALTEFEAALRDIRATGSEPVPGIDPGVAKLINATFTRKNDATLCCFTDTVRDIIAEIEAGQVPEQTTLTELIRMVSEDLVKVLDAILGTARIAFDLGHRTTQEMAFADDLTGLPNRRALHQMAMRVEKVVAEGGQVTLFLLDLDRFKDINDTHGHAGGDLALKHAASALQGHTRLNDLVARVGGDEFALLMFGAFDDDALDKRAASLAADIGQPLMIGTSLHSVGASVGIAVARPFEQITLEMLLSNADLALYAAKNGGRGQHRFFAGKLRTRREEMEALSRQIVEGIKADQFVPYFQPQVNGRTGALVGVEALVRWNHPDRGVLTPFHFMETAEECDLMSTIDDVMMRKSLAAMRDWRTAKLNVPQVSLNLAAARLADDSFVDQISWMVESYGLEPEMIGLEILESAMVEAKSDRLIGHAKRLSQAGFRLELDDFGTGHASIANLRHFTVTRIKIDKSFIKDLHVFSDLSKITTAMISLAHSLRIDALAEGVESPEERLVLNALGCDFIQGYGVARPMPAEEIPAWIRKTQRPIKLPLLRRNSA